MKVSARSLSTVFVVFSLLVAAVEVSRSMWFGAGSAPNETFTALTALPHWAIEDPRANGYFLLLGFSASPALDPIETGHRMWIEAETRGGQGCYDYAGPGRAHFVVDQDSYRLLEAWSRPEAPLTFKRLADALNADAGRQAVLLDRYGQWLGLRFEDRGFGQAGSPRYNEIFATHRLFVASGFAVGLETGAARLERDLHAWRTVLARAMTLPTKIAATVVVEDDMALLSSLLNLHDLDPALLARLRRLARPLTPEERSLRRPIQNEFVIAVSQAAAPAGTQAERAPDGALRWLEGLAGLPPAALQRVGLARAFGAIARAPVRRQKTLNTYALYTHQLIAYSESPGGPPPKLQDAAAPPQRRFYEVLLSPIETAGLAEPQWQPIFQRVTEADARLRLVALQALLLGAPGHRPVPLRIAQAGSSLFDPFTGMPMLWHPASGRLYSVGADGRDDEADPGLDIAIPVALPAGTDAPPRPIAGRS